jgi:hypothetical protein
MIPMDTFASGSDPNDTSRILSEHEITLSVDQAKRVELAAVSEIPEFRYPLLSPPGQRIDGNSYEMLRPFLDKDPNHPEREPDRAFIRRQIQLLPAEMDLDKVKGYLDLHQEKLAILSKSALCKTIQWPRVWMPPVYEYMGSRYEYSMESTPSDSPSKPELTLPISEYPDLVERLETAGLLIALKARYHIVRGDYSQGCQWIQIGLAQARQMATNSNALLGLAGMASATRILQQIEVWIQRPGSPSLFRSFQDLPDPLVSGVSWEEPIQGSDHGDQDVRISIEPAAACSRQPFTLERQLRRFVAILGCMESIRLHAALNQQRLPGSLSEIQEVRVPVDPLTGKSFGYTIDGDSIVLGSMDSSPPGRFEFRYQLIERPVPESHPPVSYPVLMLPKRR